MTPEQLDRGMLLRMLHLTEDADPALLSSLDRCTAALCEAVRPRTVWRLLFRALRLRKRPLHPKATRPPANPATS